MSFETIETRIEDRIGVITLNRPRVLNAINRTLMREVTAALAAFTADDAILAILVNGAGRAFSAGFDMKQSAQRPTPTMGDWQKILRDDFDFIIQFWDCPKPTVAAVHGFCLAGAFELALACDVTVAAEGTLFGEPEARFGSGIIALLLPWMTSPKVAMKILGSDGQSSIKEEAGAAVQATVDKAKDSLRNVASRELEAVKDKAKAAADKAADSLRNVADKKIQEAKDKATQELGNKAGEVVGKKADEILGDQGKKTVDDAKKKLEGFDPFKKKKKDN